VGAQLFAGTFVTEGEPVMVVTAIGGQTRLAQIAALSRAGARPTSPLTVRLDRVVRVVALIAVLVGSGFFGIALLLGTPARDGFLFAVGVTVALVPEGLLPTVTLSLALGARRMAERNALVRSLESVETLGSTTFLCTDKTGTLTRNEMAVVAVWTPNAEFFVRPVGYDADERLADAGPALNAAAEAAVQASTGRVFLREGRWQPHGDPMEAALHVLALRASGASPSLEVEPDRRLTFDPRRRRMSAVVAGRLVVKGAVDAVLPRCTNPPDGAAAVAAAYGARGLRVLAVALRVARPGDLTGDPDDVETDLLLLGLIALEDPPREGAAEAVTALRRASIKVAMITGDHPATAQAIAEEVGLLVAGSRIVEAADLPAASGELAELVDRDGIVIARAAPEDKLRIAEALQSRGHVVAMTGDGVNDGPALSRADVGIALGRSGTDVARETADLVLLDDHLATVVVAVEVGRTTFMNVRKFLTYHLTDNVAELTPFVVWALSGGAYPLALSVLQVLALDIGTDLLPAIALGAEPPSGRVLDGPMKTDRLIDRRLMTRVFGVLGPAEAIGEMTAFTLVLLAGGWVWGAEPSVALLAAASGAAFSAVVLGQMANAFACRSATRWVGMMRWTSNRLLLLAVASELMLLLVFVGLPATQQLLGGGWPTTLGWLLAFATIPLLLAADTVHKFFLARHRSTPALMPSESTYSDA
jgi:calcium-translocating P-type ATPase